MSTTPPSIAALWDHEVAVLDPANSRLLCFDLSGASTCSVPLPIGATGDLFGIGDGTLIAIDIRSPTGKSDFNVIRIDPKTENAVVILHEFPFVSPATQALPPASTSCGMHPAAPAWVGLPSEQGNNAVAGPPDPTLFPAPMACTSTPR